MKLKGKITISRPSYGSGEKWIEINVVDETSGCEFLEVKMTYEQFAIAVTGMGHVDCLLDFRETMPIGKKHEHKQELVQRPPITGREDREKTAKKYFKPFEVDGWKGRTEDLFNHHCWGGGDKVRVTFDRYVDVETVK